jgi:CRP-like cAMP-binding protein
MEDLKKAIADHLFFRTLDEHLVDKLAHMAASMSCPGKAHIFKEDDPADGFWLITEGHVALSLHDEARGEIVFETLSRGDVLGWSWAVPPHRWAFTATATDLVRAVEIDGDALRKACAVDHELGYQVLSRLMSTLADRVRHTRIRLLDVYGQPS